MFAMRSMASGAAFHRAYLHATQQAFLEAHEHAFAYFGGVFNMLRYDNLASAVRKILRGHRREETVRFMAFRSHWRFAAEFCTPGEGHEKGGIEGEGGYFRRNHLVPVPCVADLDAFNALLLTACRADEARILAGRSETIGAAMAVERGHLLSRVTEGFDLAEVMFPLTDKQGCVTVKTNFYSVPVRAGSRVEARVHPLHIEIWHAGRLVARHERCHSRRQPPGGAAPGPAARLPLSATKCARRRPGRAARRALPRQPTPAPPATSIVALLRARAERAGETSSDQAASPPMILASVPRSDQASHCSDRRRRASDWLRTGAGSQGRNVEAGRAGSVTKKTVAHPTLSPPKWGGEGFHYDE